MPTCSFCKRAYQWPHGVSVVQKDGSVRFYCSGKCRKNNNMGRNNKKLKWTQNVTKESIKKEEE